MLYVDPTCHIMNNQTPSLENESKKVSAYSVYVTPRVQTWSI